MSIPKAVLTPDTVVEVYERKSATKGYRFYVVAFPPGERPVYAYDDDEKRAVDKVEALVKLGQS